MELILFSDLGLTSTINNQQSEYLPRITLQYTVLFAPNFHLLYFIDRQNGSLVLRLGGLWWMCWPNEPNWNIFGWNCFGFSFKLPGLILVGPSANSINSRLPSPVMILKSCSLISWCSCLPRTSNYWVRSHRIIWIKGSVLLPPSFSLLASREFLFFLRIVVELCSDACRGRLSEAVSLSCAVLVWRQSILRTGYSLCSSSIYRAIKPSL